MAKFFRCVVNPFGLAVSIALSMHAHAYDKCLPTAVFGSADNSTSNSARIYVIGHKPLDAEFNSSECNKAKAILSGEARNRLQTGIADAADLLILLNKKCLIDAWPVESIGDRDFRFAKALCGKPEMTKVSMANEEFYMLAPHATFLQRRLRLKSGK